MPAINRQSAAETLTEERCHIREIINSDDDPAVSIARARVEPGVTTAWHAVLNTVERFVILQGSGEVFIGDAPAEAVDAGDTVHIAAGVKQRMRNSGQVDLVFDCICTPRFAWQNYQSLD